MYKYIGCTMLAMVLSAGVRAQDGKDSLINVAFGSVAQEDVIHAISKVNTAKLTDKLNSSYSLIGLDMVGGYTGNIWGQEALIMVDGMPRSAANVRASEVESVTVLKDAASVALYGSRAAKGVILITTKRGKEQDMQIDVRANAGINLPKAFPNYLDADCYMTLYNEARRNDGLSDYYDAATIYNTAMGTNPYRYPDIDFYSDDYLRKMYYNADMTGEIYD